MNKAQLLSWLREEYRQWQALLDRIGEAHMDQPGVNGGWSMAKIRRRLGLIVAEKYRIVC